jgi:DNA-binding transcriptional MerR regulator
MPAAPRVSGQRRYGPAAVEAVGMILLLRDTGFSLSEIGALTGSRSRSPGAWRALARQKLTELDERIARAEAARVALQHALRCRHGDLLDCPSFAGVLAARLSGQPLAQAHDH